MNCMSLLHQSTVHSSGSTTSGSTLKNQWQNIREILGRIDRLISYYEMKEATTIFELAWRKARLVNGEGCNIIEVPDPVKVTISEYFYSQNN